MLNLDSFGDRRKRRVCNPPQVANLPHRAAEPQPKAGWKAGCGQDWPPHNLRKIVANGEEIQV
jgi:hypothetical protein